MEGIDLSITSPQTRHDANAEAMPAGFAPMAENRTVAPLLPLCDPPSCR
jgi:hypothetical protein